MSPSQDNASRTISTVMVITLLGKVLGLLRDRLLAVYYGTGMEANAFYTASLIPRVFFDAIFASAIAACFIPVFSGYLAKQGKKEAFQFSASFITLMLFLTTLLCGVGVLFAPQLVTLFASGYDADTTALAVSLTRVMFPTIIFTGTAFAFVGILQAMNNFHIPALISSVANLAIILYFLFFNSEFGIYGLAGAYLVAWLLQALIQIPSLHKLGYRQQLGFQWRSQGMYQVFVLMVPVMVSTWVQPINLTINSHFASYLYEGAGVSAIQIATTLYLIIAGVFVLSVTNVIFPKLSYLTTLGNQVEFRNTLRDTIRGTLFLILPMGAGLMVVSNPLVDFIYGGGEFDAFSVGITAQALCWLSLGMVGYAVQNILSRAYFAKQEGKVPLIAGGISIFINIVLCALLLEPLGITGLALSSALSSISYAILLLIPLERSSTPILNIQLVLALLRMVGATLLMAVSAWSVMGLVGGLIEGKLGLLFTLSSTALVGGAVYFVAAILLGLSEGQLILSTVKRFVKRG